MTDPEPSRPARPPGPPARPRFEFRARPSAVTLQRPHAVRVSFVLWLGAAGAGLLASVLMVLGLDTVEASLQTVLLRDFPAESAATRDRVTALTSAVLIGGGALIAAGQAGFAGALYAGRGGARFALVLLAVLAVVHTLLAVGVAPLAAAAVLPVGVGLAAAAAVAMLLPGTYRWFTLKQR
ncbi:MAG TPA: hypothetical protein VM367_03110 [Pseudonocardia sp.]|nr:hypothetical protein [Pseudonocardia sp.]